MRVLLTRAVEDAARTRAALEALGHRVILSPVIAIEPTGVPWPGGVVDAVLATSAHAFRAMPDEWGPTAEARRLLPLRLVGTRTHEAAQAAGFLGSALVTANAVSLVMEMGKRHGAGRTIYLAGRDRKPDIETALSVTEQTVEVVETYRAEALDALDAYVVEALARDAIDAAFHFSRRSAQIFLDAVGGAHAKPPPLNLCLSPDVAEPLAEAGWVVRTATAPNEATLIAMLRT